MKEILMAEPTAEEQAEKALSGIAFGRLWCGICGSYDNECGCGCIDPKEARSERERSKAIEVVEKAIREAEEAARQEERQAFIEIIRGEKQSLEILREDIVKCVIFLKEKNEGLQEALEEAVTNVAKYASEDLATDVGKWLKKAKVALGQEAQ